LLNVIVHASHGEHIMAELMSIQVHVPLMKVGNQYVESGMAENGGVKVEKWRKVGNDGRSLYQSTKQTINIEFKDLTYSVSEGRQKGV